MMIAQPMLLIPPEIERGLMDGTLKLYGSVVRKAADGTIFKHLKEVVPSPEQLQRGAKGLKLNPKIVISVVAITTVVGVGVAGVTYVANKRKQTTLIAPEALPECVTSFEASLRAYIEAGRTSALDAEVIETLIIDLDAVKAYSEDGNEVVISLDDLVPLFDLVIAHTPKLAEAYAVEFEGLDKESGEAEEDGVVVSLRRHLKAQKRILGEVA